MSFPDANSTLKRLRNRYRLVLMNDDTFEEVITFKLSRISVYIALCSLFVLLVGLTVGLLAFTPLKLYIPGYNEGRQGREYQQLKLRADSIEHALDLKQQYFNDVQMVLQGKVVKRDTTILKIKNPGKSTN